MRCVLLSLHAANCVKQFLKNHKDNCSSFIMPDIHNPINPVKLLIGV